MIWWTQLNNTSLWLYFVAIFNIKKCYVMISKTWYYVLVIGFCVGLDIASLYGFGYSQKHHHDSFLCAANWSIYEGPYCKSFESVKYFHQPVIIFKRFGLKIILILSIPQKLFLQNSTMWLLTLLPSLPLNALTFIGSPRCLRRNAVLHLESMLSLMRCQPSSVMPNL